MVDAKMDGELKKYHKEQNIGELADLLEVVRAAAVTWGYLIEQLEEICYRKRTARGGFDKDILLREVWEEE